LIPNEKDDNNNKHESTNLLDSEIPVGSMEQSNLTLTNIDLARESTLDDTEYVYSKELNTKGNKRSMFWLISVFSSTGQFFFGNFFSAFAAEVGVSGALMGFITSVRNLFSSIFQGFIGFLSDRIGRKFIMLLGIFFNFAITVPLIFYQSRGLIVAIAIIQALSLSVFTPAWNAVLGDVTRPEFRATFIGKITSIGRLLSVVFSIVIAVVFFLCGEDGPLYGRIIWGWTVDIPWRTQYSIAFAIAAINSLICSIIIFFMKETRSLETEIKRPQFRIAFKETKFMKFVVFYSLFGFSMSFIWPVNPMVQVNVLDMEFYQIAIVVSVFIITMSIVQVLAGILGDRFGRKPVSIIGAFFLVLYPISMLPSIITGKWEWLILGNVIAGFGTGTFFVTLNALTLDMAPDNLMGAYSGVREMFWGIATFIGSLSAGFIVDALDANYGLHNAAIIMSVGVTILRLLMAFGLFFVTESLPKETREKRMNGFNNKSTK